MSPSIGVERSNALVRATRLALARAKRRGCGEVEPDDLLAGLLHANARLGIVILGPLTIDLERFGEEPLEEADASGPKVAYSDEAAGIFDRAAAVARADGSPGIEPVHMMAAFAPEEDGLMGRLKSVYELDAAEWRAALVRWSEEGGPGRNGSDGARPREVRELLSPDEAADFLGVHTQTVRGYIRSGKLPAHRIAGERAIRIRRRDLLDLLEPYDPE